MEELNTLLPGPHGDVFKQEPSFAKDQGVPGSSGGARSEDFCFHATDFYVDPVVDGVGGEFRLFVLGRSYRVGLGSRKGEQQGFSAG